MSALAWVIRGQALRGAGNEAAAQSAFASARDILEGGLDSATWFTSPDNRNALLNDAAQEAEPDEE